jgi:hypothetical protein
MLIYLGGRPGIRMFFGGEYPEMVA